MIEFSRVVTDPLGLHARPALRLAQEAQRWESAIEVFRGGRRADGRDSVALLALDAETGSELRVCVEGPDEADAAEFLAHVLRDL